MILQTSTANPYGHRPWATRLYTTFDDFAFLKQPQNTILRGNPAMRPEIYKPPEMAGLGAVTLVSGSGRVLGRTRRRRTLGAMANGGALSIRGFYFPTYPRPVSQIRVVGPVTSSYPAPLPDPITILPPSLVPPPPTVVSSGPSGTVYSLPGTPATPGSPFAPPAPGELPGAGAPPAADAAASLSDWFNRATWIAGIPNGYVALGAAGVLYFMARKPKR